jgi:hypothetical protein
MGILNGQIRVQDGSGDLAVAVLAAADFHQAVLAVAAVALAEGVHPEDGKSGFRNKLRIRKWE